MVQPAHAGWDPCWFNGGTRQPESVLFSFRPVSFRSPSRRRPPSRRVRRPWRAPLALAVLVNLGAVGYRLTEGWDWGDCYWMVAITLSTIGYGEVQPLSTPAAWSPLC